MQTPGQMSLLEKSGMHEDLSYERSFFTKSFLIISFNYLCVQVKIVGFSNNVSTFVF